MEGCHPRARTGIVLLAAAWLATSAVTARAQDPAVTGRLTGDYAGVLDLEGPSSQPAASYLNDPRFIPELPSNGYGPPVEMGLLGTIADSLFGDVYATGRWRPLGLGTFFTEGWFEPWASGPAGQSGLTPRQGWLGAFEGVFYRLWLNEFSYLNRLNKPYGGQGYSSSFTIFLPLSRRFELSLGIPYVVANGTSDSRRGYRSDFGDMAVAGRFLLSESEATTQTFNLSVQIPTGKRGTGGDIMALTPRYEFWTNPGGPWVVRGGASVAVPLNKNAQREPLPPIPNQPAGFRESTSQTAFGGDLAIGRYFTPHDAPFGDLVLYAACNITVPFEDRNRPVFFGGGPGLRFHIGNDWYFLHHWEFPMVGPLPYDYQMQVAILKVF